MSYAPIVARTLTNGLDSFEDVEENWDHNLWSDDNNNDYNTSGTASRTRNQFEYKGSSNSAQEHTYLHARASTASVIDPPGRTGLRSRKVSAHRRAATAEDSTTISLSDSKVTQARTHPLQVPKTPTDRDAFVTRPSLKRWLSNGANSMSHVDDGFLGTQEGGYSEWITQTKEAETMVIVHEVSRADSLAGVALKYGIALADLRRVNHLWASDPIHLRKVLYIPVHLTNKRLAIAESQLLNGQHMHVEEESGSSKSSTLGRSTQSVVQRVPISQLSFFPPSSSKSTTPSPSLHSTNPGFTNNGSNPYATSPRISRARSASANGASGPSLSSFIQAIQQQFAIPPLPLPLPLARPRISLDSTDISSSVGTAAASEASSDQEHEMDVLGRYRTRINPQSPHEGTRGDAPNVGTSGYVAKDDPNMIIPFVSSKSNTTPKRRSAVDSKKYTSSGRISSQSTRIPSQLQPPVADPVPLVPVTEQLKPSARMEFPRSSS